MSDAHDDPVESQEAVEAQEAEASEPTAAQVSEKDDMDTVVTDLLQGKYSTDAAEQRRRLSAAGHDPEEVQAAVRRRLAQRYE